MEVIQELAKVKFTEPSVVTVGVFDGLHVGHQAIMRMVKAAAPERCARSVVVTFDRNPEQIVNPGHSETITTLRQKLDLIAAQGIDCTVVLPLRKSLLDMSPERFITNVLKRKLKTVQLIVGTNFAFGKERAGNLELLRDHGAKEGFEVTGVSPIRVDGILVSSTVIRKLLRAGNLEKANVLLGHPFVLEGEVTEGRGIGRTLGYPTANIEAAEHQILPAYGVYAVTVSMHGARWVGVANLGVRPTVGGSVSTTEVYLIGFQGNIYGRRLEVGFHHRLREEKRFPDREHLKRQIALDVEAAVRLVGSSECNLI